MPIHLPEGIVNLRVIDRAIRLRRLQVPDAEDLLGEVRPEVSARYL